MDTTSLTSKSDDEKKTNPSIQQPSPEELQTIRAVRIQQDRQRQLPPAERFTTLWTKRKASSPQKWVPLDIKVPEGIEDNPQLPDRKTALAACQRIAVTQAQSGAADKFQISAEERKACERMLPIVRKERERLVVRSENLAVNIGSLEDCLKAPVVGVPQEEEKTPDVQE